MHYKASLGTTSLLITVLATLLLGSMITFFLYRAITAVHTAEVLIFVFICILIAGLFILTYLYSPVLYVVTKETITINRRISDVIISVNEIRDAFSVKKESMTGVVRVGGNGGLFGFYGNFQNHFGQMKWYGTKLSNYVMIETMNNERIVLTPDNTDMVKEIRGLIANKQNPTGF
jgi:hypothetical protein